MPQTALCRGPAQRRTVSADHDVLESRDAGCTGTVCGIPLSPMLEDFLNFPNLNLLLCGLLADCTNVAYTDGTVGEVSEQLTITLSAPTASSNALIAAGDTTVRRAQASWLQGRLGWIYVRFLGWLVHRCNRAPMTCALDRVERVEGRKRGILFEAWQCTERPDCQVLSHLA